MAYVEIQDANSTPLSLHYEEWGDAKSPTLLLVHELGGTLESFRAFGAALATKYRVISFDQRGAGLSQKPTKPFTCVDLAGDIDGLVEKLGISRPFHLLGLAMGALTALQFAMQHSDQLASLVLCDGTAEIKDATSKYLLDQAAIVRRDGVRAVAEPTFKTAFRGLTEPADKSWTAYRHQFLSYAADCYAMHCEALANVKFDPAGFGKISCPTLALTGKNDVIWSPSAGEKLAASIPNARFEVVENAAHLPPIQDVAGVSARVAQFISGGG